MRSKGLPFIVWGSGGWTLVRLECLVGSSTGRRRVVVRSLIPCLWGKLQNLSFSNVSKQVVMSFCVAGVALCDIPTCLITCRKCQNWRMSRTKCSFCCAHVSPLESMVFLWRRRVYGGSCKTCPFRMFPSRLSCRFAWQAWHFVTFQPVCDDLSKVSKLEDVSHEMLVLLRPRVSSRVYGFPVASPCLCGKLQDLSFLKASKQVVMSFCVASVALCDIPTCLITCRNFFCVAGATMHSTFYTLHFKLHTRHSTFYTPHSTLHTPPHFTHSTLLTPHFTLHTLHFTLYT